MPESREIAIEGEGRVPDFEVSKGHHSYGAMRRDFTLADIVYLVRDVRDVTLSGAPYFPFKPRPGSAK